jgi:ATP-dependent helicase Lhr and Lhr-like helicase
MPFAGDDRGWHLLALLERVSRLADSPVQRIALSATLSNADELLNWLVTGADVPRQVVAGAASGAADIDVQVDYVGSLTNAAVVISRLHQGEKRLVFCDSRTQVESLASELARMRAVETYVSHSSLSRDERKRAEHAFSQGSNCVIVATSTLELGIDVGDLDRVIQIDAPHTVASFLQRVGRSGRRAGTRRNCLFLATREATLLRALGILQLWSEGYVEPVIPPPLPYHVIGQQLLALCLQEAGIGRAAADDWLGRFRMQTGVAAGAYHAVLQHMLDTGLLFDDGGVLGIGLEGERTYGHRNFMEVFSVFNTPPLFTVLQGRTEIGQVHELTFTQQRQRPIRIALGGRGWKVTHVDWDQKRAYVEPDEERGKSRWLGAGQGLHFELCQGVKRVLVSGGNSSFRSRRAEATLQGLRADFSWVAEGTTTLVAEGDQGVARWWTFAGDRYNGAAAALLQAQGCTCVSDGFALTVQQASAMESLPARLLAVAGRLASAGGVEHSDDALDRIKFRECVPDANLAEMIRRRGDPTVEAGTIAEHGVVVR